MKKMIIAATLATVIATMATGVMAHRSSQSAPEKPDFTKTLFDKQQRNGR